MADHGPGYTLWRDVRVNPQKKNPYKLTVHLEKFIYLACG